MSSQNNTAGVTGCDTWDAVTLLYQSYADLQTTLRFESCLLSKVDEDGLLRAFSPAAAGCVIVIEGAASEGAQARLPTLHIVDAVLWQEQHFKFASHGCRLPPDQLEDLQISLRLKNGGCVPLDSVSRRPSLLHYTDVILGRMLADFMTRMHHHNSSQQQPVAETSSCTVERNATGVLHPVGRHQEQENGPAIAHSSCSSVDWQLIVLNAAPDPTALLAHCLLANSVVSGVLNKPALPKSSIHLSGCPHGDSFDATGTSSPPHHPGKALTPLADSAAAACNRPTTSSPGPVFSREAVARVALRQRTTRLCMARAKAYRSAAVRLASCSGLDEDGTEISEPPSSEAAERAAFVCRSYHRELVAEWRKLQKRMRDGEEGQEIMAILGTFQPTFEAECVSMWSKCVALSGGRGAEQTEKTAASAHAAATAAVAAKSDTAAAAAAAVVAPKRPRPVSLESPTRTSPAPFPDLTLTGGERERARNPFLFTSLSAAASLGDGKADTATAFGEACPRAIRSPKRLCLEAISRAAPARGSPASDPPFFHLGEASAGDRMPRAGDIAGPSTLGVQEAGVDSRAFVLAPVPPLCCLAGPAGNKEAGPVANAPALPSRSSAERKETGPAGCKGTGLEAPEQKGRGAPALSAAPASATAQAGLAALKPAIPAAAVHAAPAAAAAAAQTSLAPLKGLILVAAAHSSQAAAIQAGPAALKQAISDAAARAAPAVPAKQRSKTLLSAPAVPQRPGTAPCLKATARTASGSMSQPVQLGPAASLAVPPAAPSCLRGLPQAGAPGFTAVLSPRKAGASVGAVPNAAGMGSSSSSPRAGWKGSPIGQRANPQGLGMRGRLSRVPLAHVKGNLFATEKDIRR